MEKKTIKVKVGVKDLFRFLMGYNYCSFGGIFGVIVSLSCLLGLAISYQDNSQGTNLLLLVVGLLFTVIQPMLLLKKSVAQCVKNPSFRSPLTYELADEGITVRLDEQSQKVEWDAITKLKENKNQILVYTSRVNAFIWPVEQLGQEKEMVKHILVEKLEPSICSWRKK